VAGATRYVAAAPEYFPAGAGHGVAFIFWGLITTGLFGWSVLFSSSQRFAGWITEIRHEYKSK